MLQIYAGFAPTVATLTQNVKEAHSDIAWLFGRGYYEKLAENGCTIGCTAESALWDQQSGMLLSNTSEEPHIQQCLEPSKEHLKYVLTCVARVAFGWLSIHP